MREQIKISQKELEELRKKENTLIVDIRERGEFRNFNVGGMNIPAHELNDFHEELEKYENLIVVCSNGMRSQIIARVLLKRYPQANIYHLQEGVF